MQFHSSTFSACRLASVADRPLTVLNPEQDQISRPDPPFSSAPPCVSCQRSQSASTCISRAVILRPWMLKLQLTPFHILNLFPGFAQDSLILACAGLFKVRLFLRRRPLPRGTLFWYFTSSAQFESCWDRQAVTGPLSPSGVRAAVAAALSFAALETTGLHKQPAMISVNFLISQPFALHVVSVTVSLLPRLPSASMCSFCPYLSVHTVPLQQQEGWSVRVTDSRRENKATHRACVIRIRGDDREQPERGGEKREKEVRGKAGWLIPLCKCLHVPRKSVQGLHPKQFVFWHQQPCSPTALSLAFQMWADTVLP